MRLFRKNNDLALEVSEEDHRQGDLSAPIQLVVYGDFGCPFTREARLTVKQLQEKFGDDLLYVYRHLPLLDKHPLAYDAARASEVAGEQGKFWEMYDRLFTYQTQQTPSDLRNHARAIGLDDTDYEHGMQSARVTERVDAHIQSAEQSRARTPPAFFINGKRHKVSTVEQLSEIMQSIWDGK